MEMSKKRNLVRILTYVLLIFFSVIMLGPFIWMLLTSLKTTEEIYSGAILPTAFRLDNFITAFTKIPYMRYMFNTLLIAVGAVIGNCIASSLVAYSMSKIQWAGRKFLFPVIIGMMLIPYQVTMIPVYMIWSKLGLTGTFLPLILPAFFGTPYYIFLLRQFFMTIPNALIEAATIDGAGKMRIFTTVMLPLCKPAITTVAIFTFLANWSDFMGPLIYLNDEKNYTLSIGLQAFLQQHYVEWGSLMAASVVFIVPVVILFFFAQKYFVEGITVTGIKG